MHGATPYSLWSGSRLRSLAVGNGQVRNHAWRNCERMKSIEEETRSDFSDAASRNKVKHDRNLSYRASRTIRICSSGTIIGLLRHRIIVPRHLTNGAGCELSFIVRRH
jgi:hypothetical protein